MKSRLLFALKSGLEYFFSSKTLHLVDSPYLFRFCRQVLEAKSRPENFRPIELLRKKLLRDLSPFERVDFGAGSLINRKSNKMTIGKFVKHSAIRPNNGRLLNRIVQFQTPTTILELGTAAGLSGAYLLLNNPGAKLITIEGDPTIASLAKSNFNALDLENAEVICGRFDLVLPEVLDRIQSVDLVFIDGHHTGDAMRKYIDVIKPFLHPSRGMIVLDDIHWNEDMMEEWKKLSVHKDWNLAIDLYQFGLLIRNPDIFESIQVNLIASKYKPWRLGLFR